MTTPTRARSHWGWGWAEKFPDRATREAFARHVGGMLGFKSLTISEPVAAADIVLPSARVAAPDALATVLTDRADERITHTYGKAYRDLLRGFRGEYGRAPDLVARPQTEEDVVAVLDWAQDHGLAVIPFGGGTSVVGGVEGPRDDFPGVVSLDMRGLDRVREVDHTSRSALIEAGATGPVLESQLAEHGLTLRHFPQSFEFSTLGGWIATRAGGHFATVYTHIDELVSATRTITPRGPLETWRLPGSGAGPSPDRMIIGSEGALGVITRAWMRLHARPRWRAKANVLYSDYGAAVEAVREISQSALYPTNCRLLDKREAMLNMLPTMGNHVLLLGFESADHPLEPWMNRALAIATSHGGTCKDGARYTDDGVREAGEGAGESWRRSFLDGPYMQNILVSLGVVVDTFETACTWDRFDALHAQVVTDVRAAMQRVSGQKGFISCRFTHVYPDGPAPYFTFLVPGRPGGELEQWAEIKHAASEALNKHGATITHHHAVGRTHRPWYDRQRPDLFADALRAAKGALDPAGILNPGVLI